MVNIASCYWSIFNNARYFARRRLKVVEGSKVAEVVLNLEGNVGKKEVWRRGII